MNEELAAFQTEVRGAFAEMRQEFAALRTEMRDGFAAIDRQFAAVDRQFAAVDRRFTAVDGRFTAVDGGFTAVNGRFTEVDRRFDSLDERVRHNGVMLESVRDDVRQLAEAHLLLDQRVERYRRESDDAHQEILALLRTSYRDLDRRVGRLEERSSEGG